MVYIDIPNGYCPVLYSIMDFMGMLFLAICFFFMSVGLS